MVVHFGVTCILLGEDVDKKLRRIYELLEEFMLPVVKNVLGEYFFVASHQYDGVILERFYLLVAEATGRIDKEGRVFMKLDKEKYMLGLDTNIHYLQVDPAASMVVDVFNMEVVMEGKNMVVALDIFIESILEFDKVPFATFLSVNGDLLNNAQIARNNALVI